MAGDAFEKALAGLRRWAGTTDRTLSGDPEEVFAELGMLFGFMPDYLGINSPSRPTAGLLNDLLLDAYPHKVTVLDRDDIASTIPAPRDLTAYLADTGRSPPRRRGPWTGNWTDRARLRRCDDRPVQLGAGHGDNARDAPRRSRHPDAVHPPEAAPPTLIQARRMNPWWRMPMSKSTDAGIVQVRDVDPATLAVLRERARSLGQSLPGTCRT